MSRTQAESNEGAQVPKIALSSEICSDFNINLNNTLCSVNNEAFGCVNCRKFCQKFCHSCPSVRRCLSRTDHKFPKFSDTPMLEGVRALLPPPPGHAPLVTPLDEDEESVKKRMLAFAS